MNFTQSAVASTGPRAGLPADPAERLLDEAKVIAKALAWLIKRGHTPIAFHTADGCKPTVQIASSRQTAALVEADKASYYKWDTTGSLPARHGLMHEGPDGVRVVWVERGH